MYSHKDYHYTFGMVRNTDDPSLTFTTARDNIEIEVPSGVENAEIIAINDSVSFYSNKELFIDRSTESGEYYYKNKQSLGFNVIGTGGIITKEIVANQSVGLLYTRAGKLWFRLKQPQSLYSHYVFINNDFLIKLNLLRVLRLTKRTPKYKISCHILTE